ncbi:MAG: stage II sporulation protein P, partial [Longicatena sp.]
QHLEEKGFKVVVETNNFKNYRDQNGIAYDRAYVVSYKYLNDALVNYGGFDLCIDLHRDSIPRNASYNEANGKTYATAMMVIGGLGKNAKSATQISTTLTDTINAKVSGMMRSPMTREAFYNQEVHPNIVLMEVGGDVNSFAEVTNSLSVIADGIYDYLEKR